MGGLHFSLTLLWSQLTTVGSAVLYINDHEPPGGNEAKKISAHVLYAVVAPLAVAWLISFVLFLLLINRDHVSTLLGTKTGKRFTVEAFQMGDDYQKRKIFFVNRRHWSSIRPEVKEWTNKNLATWIEKETRPDWFNPAFVSRVPHDFFPRELLIPKDKRKRRETIFGKQLLATMGKERSTGKVAQAPM